MYRLPSILQRSTTVGHSATVCTSVRAVGPASAFRSVEMIVLPVPAQPQRFPVQYFRRSLGDVGATSPPNKCLIILLSPFQQREVITGPYVREMNKSKKGDGWEVIAAGSRGSEDT